MVTFKQFIDEEAVSHLVSTQGKFMAMKAILSGLFKVARHLISINPSSSLHKSKGLKYVVRMDVPQGLETRFFGRLVAKATKHALEQTFDKFWCAEEPRISEWKSPSTGDMFNTVFIDFHVPDHNGDLPDEP